MIDYWTLEFIASFLLVVGFTRTMTLRVPWSLWHLATYTLVGMIGAASLLVFLGESFHIEVYFAGLAFVVGLTWTGLAQDHRPLPKIGYLLSASGAVGVTGILTFLALNYRWWTAPLIILGMIGLAIVRDFLVFPALNWVRTHRFVAPIGRADEGALLRQKTLQQAPLLIPEDSGKSPTTASNSPKPVSNVNEAPPVPPEAMKAVRGRGSAFAVKTHASPRGLRAVCPRCLRSSEYPKAALDTIIRCPKCGANLILNP